MNLASNKSLKYSCVCDSEPPPLPLAYLMLLMFFKAANWVQPFLVVYSKMTKNAFLLVCYNIYIKQLVHLCIQYILLHVQATLQLWTADLCVHVWYFSMCERSKHFILNVLYIFFFWSCGNMDSMLFTFENRVLLMR